jgi:hypothetical protein
MIQPTKFDPKTKSIVTSISDTGDNNIRVYDINLNSVYFKHIIEAIIKENDIQEVVETGSFNGLGSTTIFANTKKPVISIECNYNNYVTATNNLSQYDNVCVVHALSTKREDALRYIMSEAFDIDTKYDSKSPKTFYLKEVCQQVLFENALDVFANNTNKQLVFLDSAGGMGFFEYLEFMKFSDEVLSNKILVLDDVTHIKHKRSVEHLKMSGRSVEISPDDRFAWCNLNHKK